MYTSTKKRNIYILVMFMIYLLKLIISQNIIKELIMNREGSNKYHSKLVIHTPPHKNPEPSLSFFNNF